MNENNLEEAKKVLAEAICEQITGISKSFGSLDEIEERMDTTKLEMGNEFGRMGMVFEAQYERTQMLVRSLKCYEVLSKIIDEDSKRELSK